MSEAELYELYLQERQWNYTSWEDFKKIYESKERQRTERDMQNMRG